MPNIASLLKEEILRLARKEIRNETAGLKKASATYRAEIAALKRRVTDLERQVGRVGKLAAKATQEAAPDAETKLRFSAKGLAKHRQRLGLSAADLGALLGVTAQSVYNWETGKTRPRDEQVAAIAALRAMGKRAAKARLEALAK